jgi:hypothetical protein
MANPLLGRMSMGASWSQANRCMAEITRGNFQGKFPRILDEAPTKVIRAYAGKRD